MDTLRDALASTDIEIFVRDHAVEPISCDGFRERHGKWCNSIVEFLADAVVQNTSFGRAAKLVAVYLKSMVVVGPHSTSNLARVAHPPIDRILLRGLTKIPGLPQHAKNTFRSTNWTTLSAEDYYPLIELIRESVPEIDPFWRLEQYWTVTQESEV